ncbi:hypothetical protein T484DRAFT_1816815, partial [Baffinella frigidus]
VLGLWQNDQLFVHLAGALALFRDEEFTPQAIANVCRAYVKVDVDEDLEMEVLARMAGLVQRFPTGAFTAQSVSSILLSYAETKKRPPNTDAVARYLSRGGQGMGASQLGP